MHKGEISELDAHSSFGHLMSKASSNYFIKQNARPFVYSRSTFSGSGKYAVHGTGDNWKTWEHMRLSISQIYQFNFF